VTALFEVSAADVADTNDDYYTPRWIFEAAGLVFDMDVSAPVDPSRRTCPALRYLTPVEDGLAQPWDGLVWMNPPYSNISPWVDRFAAHGSGLALLPVLKRCLWMGVLLRSADALALISAYFGRPDGNPAKPSFPLMLIGCGSAAIEAVGQIAAVDKYIGGAYHVRPEAQVSR
jgi:DNA N-6-adenine-methyltransferase (Dam)